MERTRNYKLAIVLFTFPALLMFTVLVAYPVVQSMIKSFTQWDGLSEAKFIGLSNYIRLFTSDIFYLANKNSLISALVLVAFQLGVGLLLALLLVSF